MQAAFKWLGTAVMAHRLGAATRRRNATMDTRVNIDTISIVGGV